jgi:hypothetical protein
MPDLKQLDRLLDDELYLFASEFGDGFNAPNWLHANDYRTEGYEIGQAAFNCPESDQDDYIETHVEAQPVYARHLVSAAATYRLAELKTSTPKAFLYLSSAA